ncbi:hypothetical protein HY488_02545 [Candidatus Woesearchaeota archaeon]|nr:hypothetical protein [Candidatus Woesearchaeota archaeon]
MDIVRFLAGVFFVVWSIVGIMALIGSILFIGFMSQASSFFESSPFAAMGGGGEFGGFGPGGESVGVKAGGVAPRESMPRSGQQSFDAACASRVLGEKRATELAKMQNPTPQEVQLLQECYR